MKTTAHQNETLVTGTTRFLQLRTMDCILFVASKERDCYIPMQVLELGATVNALDTRTGY